MVIDWLLRIILATEISLISLLDVLIGFEHINYTVSETIGQVMINVTVLGGSLTHPISIVVSTSDGTARGKDWTPVYQKLIIVCV